MDNLETRERKELRKFLSNRFNLDELKVLAFDIGVDLEGKAQSRQMFAAELISYCERRDLERVLIEEILENIYDPYLDQILKTLPPGRQLEKLQIVVTGNLSQVNETQLKQNLSRVLSIESEEIEFLFLQPLHLIVKGDCLRNNCSEDSMHMLISLPQGAVGLGAVSKIYNLGQYQVLSIDFFDSLDLTSQKAWRLIASELLPIRQGSALRPAISWQEALEMTFAPSNLLHYKSSEPYDDDHDQISSIVYKQLRKSRKHRLQHAWKQAQSYGLEALKSCKSHDASQAVAQIHLVDIYREIGELGLAIDHCKKAYQILQSQSALVQRHNEAVAAYALGLLHELQLFNTDQQAIQNYEKALELFEIARVNWSKYNAKSEIETCDRVRQWIKDRRDKIVARHIGEYSGKPAFNIWRLDSKKSPFAKNGHPQGFILDDHKVLIDNTEYYAHSGDLSKASIGNTYYHFASPVPKEQWLFSEAQATDYVFIRQQWNVNQEGPGVIWEPGDGWLTVDFTRDKEGKIQFIPRSLDIIGDPAGKLKGYVTALLKPTSAPQQPSPPPSHTPPPSPQAPVEPSERYNQLVNLVGGDRATANRLIEYERQQAPGADVAEWVERAITRLERDRR